MHARMLQQAEKKGEGLGKTYDEWDDTVHCGVLPIATANEGYERGQDT